MKSKGYGFAAGHNGPFATRGLEVPKKRVFVIPSDGFDIGPHLEKLGRTCEAVIDDGRPGTRVECFDYVLVVIPMSNDSRARELRLAISGVRSTFASSVNVTAAIEEVCAALAI